MKYYAYKGTVTTEALQAALGAISSVTGAYLLGESPARLRFLRLGGSHPVPAPDEAGRVFAGCWELRWRRGDTGWKWLAIGAEPAEWPPALEEALNPGLGLVPVMELEPLAVEGAGTELKFPMWGTWVGDELLETRIPGPVPHPGPSQGTCGSHHGAGRPGAGSGAPPPMVSGTWLAYQGQPVLLMLKEVR